MRNIVFALRVGNGQPGIQGSEWLILFAILLCFVGISAFTFPKKREEEQEKRSLMENDKEEDEK